VLNFDKLTDKAKNQSASSCGKGSNLPDIHVHNYFGEKSNVLPLTQYNPKPPRPKLSNALSTGSSPKHKHNHILESDDESDLEPIKIEDMLQNLNNSMLTFNFPQYQEFLLSNGICYGHSITDFNQSHYVDKVRMLDGAAAKFVRSANQMLAKQKRELARKKMRATGKEN
jgi:hypothetical protein